MQKLQDSVFSIVRTTNLSPAVFSYLQPSEDSPDKTPLGGILKDTIHGWLALGPKFCVVDLRTGLKVAARTFGASVSNFRTQVTSVVELPTPLTAKSQQLVISLECEDVAGMICVFHINGSQILRCIQTNVVVTQLAVYDGVPDGPLTRFDGICMAGTKTGEIFVFDLRRASLIQALKDTAQGFEHMIRTEENSASISFVPLNEDLKIDSYRKLALANDDHIAVLLNENSLVDGQYIFRNPDGTVRMKAKRDHIRVTVVQYIPQLGSLAVGFNFGAFQIWNLVTLALEFTSQVNVECLPVTQFGFQEPCDDPRAFCYLWVVFSVIDRFEEEEFPLAVMYSLTYQGKRMLSVTKCLYEDFLTATVRFQVELSTAEQNSQLVGGRCISCHSYSVNSALGSEGEDSMLNLVQLIWECWTENASVSTQHGLLLFDLDQWYKEQMPATTTLASNAFMSATSCPELGRGCTTLDVRLAPQSVAAYLAPARLEEHFYPNSLQQEFVCLNTSEACVLGTIGIQRQIINSMDEVGPTALLNPQRLYHACLATGLVPLYVDPHATHDPEEQRRYLLSVALEARLNRLLKRCAHDWATGSHGGASCTLPFLVDWCWRRAIELKENARDLTSPLFTTSALPDRNVVRCLEHCVQQLTQLTGLLDSILTKCCNLVVPDALNEMEDKYKAIGTVSLYFQVVQWFLRCGLLPERTDASSTLSYPAASLADTYSKRRMKLHRLVEQTTNVTVAKPDQPCPLLYIDQLIEHEFGGDRIHQMWIRGGSETRGLYPPPSLYALLRLYLLPDVSEEHKHSLVLYLLVDYSMVYDEVRYETVIRRLMQFPTMFGLSNTAIKATQAFWHLDHRDFDFALDQLQCLTGNTLSEWQHSVVLSSLLAQKKTQAALQYLHVRKPAPIQHVGRDDLNHSNNKVNDHDKLEDWQSCCNLYLARGLVFEALDVVRMCVQNAVTKEDKVTVITYFFKGCRNTGQLSKLLQVTLLPFEEEVFVNYLEACDEAQASDLLIMYYLQQARYLEAEQYNAKLKRAKPRIKDITGSLESLAEILDRQTARDTLVDVVCSSLPTIANTVAHCAFEKDIESHIIAAKPMSVFVQAKSPKNTFTYKSSFIQDTIENASETWMNKPMMRRGMKRALNVEDTPFICTPKLSRGRSIFTIEATESTPAKRAKLDLTGTPKTPRPNAFRGEQISIEVSALLDMPEEPSPVATYDTRSETPHSILKTRICESPYRGAVSPVDSRMNLHYLLESDEELETASNHTHYSDSTNKHLRFTIPTASESGSTPSPKAKEPPTTLNRDQPASHVEKDSDLSFDSYSTTESHPMNEPHPLESPPKKLATEVATKSRSYKDSVKARRSLSLSANSSLTEDPNTSIESIADIPITLINPRYSGERLRHVSPNRDSTETRDTEAEGRKGEVLTLINPSSSGERPRHVSPNRDSTETRNTEAEGRKGEVLLRMEAPKTPKGRKSIRGFSGESTPVSCRSVTPERMDSPVVLTPLRPARITRSRSRTPEISPRSSPLEPIPEQPRQECESEPHAVRASLSLPRPLRVRSRTPERIEKILESPKLEAISESPTKESPTSSPTQRQLRSRSCTPEVEISEPISEKDAFRRRAKTPEKLMSPKKDCPKSAKKPLSRLVLEANAAKTIQKEKEIESENKHAKILECTPMKSLKPVPSLMDVTISPIASKSILQSSSESILEAKDFKSVDNSVTDLGIKSIPAFTMNETRFGKSVLNSYESSIAETETSSPGDVKEPKEPRDLKYLPAFTLNESYVEKSVLKSYQSSVGDASSQDNEKSIIKMHKIEKESRISTSLNISNISKSILKSYQSMDDNNSEPSTSKALSSLMTSDSDIDVDLKDAWTKIDKEAAIIQKEKEKINEIQREIHEFEGAMSDEDEEEDAEGESDEETVSEDLEEEESEDETTSEVDQEEPLDDEVISIIDTDSEEVNLERKQTDSDAENSDVSSASSSIKLRIYDDGDKEVQIALIETEEKVTHTDIEVEGDTAKYEQRKQEKVEATDPLNLTEIAKPEVSQPLSNVSKAEVSGPLNLANISQVESSDPLNVANISILTDDASLQDQSHIAEEQNKPEDVDLQSMETDAMPTTHAAVKVGVVVEVTPSEPIEQPMEVETAKPSPESVDVVDTSATFAETISAIETEQAIEDNDKKTKEKEPEIDIRMNVEHNKSEEKSQIDEKYVKDVPRTREQAIVDKDKETKEKEPEIDIRMNVEQKKSKEKSQIDEKVVEDVPRTRRRTGSTSSNKSTKSTKELKETDKLESIEESSEKDKTEDKRTRRRAGSTSSNKSTKSTKEPKETDKLKSIEESSEKDKIEDEKQSKNIEPKTPQTRKRTKSNTSNKSLTDEQKITEVETPKPGSTTPSTRRSKTPTTVVTPTRNILTRRASKELSGSLDESQTEPITPTRRTRSRSKNISDDNASIASASSVGSAKSMASDLGEKPLRKSRKSVLSNKTDLSVIPELINEESKTEDSGSQEKQDIMSEYSKSRRLTRHQRSLLESWLEPAATPSPRRAASHASDGSNDDDEVSPSSGMDAQSMDRINLLNKGDFEGSPDPSEAQSNISPESIASDASKQTRETLSKTRAASESRTVPKAARIGRRVSVDLAALGTSEQGSPAPGSPARGRRASFNKACEALHLHTPKGRRVSTDVKKGEAESMTDSPPSDSSATPSRRGRRPSSHYSSATSASKPDAGKRSKRTPSLDESKNTKQ